MLAVQRRLDIVDRLRAGGRHDIADRPPRLLGRLPRRLHMWRGGCRVFLLLLAQILPVDPRVVVDARSHLLHDLAQIHVDGLVIEQALVELALDLLGQRGPVAADDLHSYELDSALRGAFTLPQTRVTLARATRTVPGSREEQP